MKNLVKGVKFLIGFDSTLQYTNISRQFNRRQAKFQTEVPGWSTSATRQQLISDYWFINVVQHFTLTYGISTLLTLLLQAGFGHPHFYLLSCLIAGAISFPVLYFSYYRPYFTAIFLPRLETVKETYDRTVSEQLEKCRKTQLPNPTLILIHYAMDKACGMNAMEANEKFAAQLLKLYGVDARSLKSNMELLLGSNIKRKGLSGRGLTEISNRFAEAFQFFEELKFNEGEKILKELETRVMHGMSPGSNAVSPLVTSWKQHFGNSSSL